MAHSNILKSRGRPVSTEKRVKAPIRGVLVSGNGANVIGGGVIPPVVEIISVLINAVTNSVVSVSEVTV